MPSTNEIARTITRTNNGECFVAYHTPDRFLTRFLYINAQHTLDEMRFGAALLATAAANLLAFFWYHEWVFGELAAKL